MLTIDGHTARIRAEGDGAIGLDVTGRPYAEWPIAKRWRNAGHTIRRLHREVTDPVGVAREESEAAARHAEHTRMQQAIYAAARKAEREREEQSKARDEAAKAAWESGVRLLGLSHVLRWTSADQYGVELSLSRMSRADALKLLAAGEAAGVFKARR